MHFFYATLSSARRIRWVSLFLLFVWFLAWGALLPPMAAGQVPQEVITECTTCQPRDIHATDLDGDSDTDLLSASSGNDQIIWHENDGGENFTAHTITTNASGAESVYTADVDGDSDLDVLSASVNDDKIAWYANDSGTLPVELVDLRVRTHGEGARLTWTTASETGNVGFYVQHQVPTQEGWERLGFIEGAGTTSELRSYQFDVEKDLGLGTHQFRLRQIDTADAAHLSEAVTLEVQMRQRAHLAAPAPNPVTEQVRLTFAVKESQETKVTVYNLLGQRVATLFQGLPPAGEKNRLEVDASELASGTYFIRLEAGETLKTRRFTVVR